MIFGTLRLLIWLAGLAVVCYIGMSFFGYTFDWEYYHSHTLVCREAVTECQKTFVQRGLEGAKKDCELQCLDWHKLIKAETQAK